MTDVFAGKVAIVTGGASGIGRAVAEGLARRGTRVILADRDEPRARAVAEALVSEQRWARAARLDVSEAAAVQALVDSVAAEHGRLDYMFNNAGIAVAGRARDMSLEDWNRLIDVNLRGVVHGVASAYPVMLRQGFGHIVNTASAAGLGPAPGLAGYAATKHAVVGLSTSLRVEAALGGVRVSVVCPGVIDTPIKDNMKYVGVTKDEVLANLPVKMHSAEACARAILRGVERNHAIIVVTAFARIGFLLYRISPSLMIRAVQAAARRSPFFTVNGQSA